jgi:hypothetical protein
MASCIERRKFLAAVGRAAAAWPLAARAQQPVVPIVGILGGHTSAEWTPQSSVTKLRTYCPGSRACRA